MSQHNQNCNIENYTLKQKYKKYRNRAILYLANRTENILCKSDSRLVKILYNLFIK